jgi:methionyl aminopeptidase
MLMPRRDRGQIELKSLDDFWRMREAGLVVARALQAMRDTVAPGVSTLDLDAVAREALREAGATSNFLHYDVGAGPYPGVICASVNDRLVHGIPAAEEVLREGDLISIDFGAIVEGWHGDAAITVEVGAVSPEAAALSAACRAALWDGLAAVQAGARLGDVSHAVERSVRAAGDYGIVRGYGGHGIGSSMHMDPHVLNYGRPHTGLRLVPGIALAIEPMITLGSAATRQLDDGWTVVTSDGSLSAHWEHSVAILSDGPWVLTAEDGGRAELAARGVALSDVAA